MKLNSLDARRVATAKTTLFLNMDTRRGGASYGRLELALLPNLAPTFFGFVIPPSPQLLWCHYPHIHVSHAEPWQISGGAVDHASGTRLTAGDWMILASKQG